MIFCLHIRKNGVNDVLKCCKIPLKLVIFLFKYGHFAKSGMVIMWSISTCDETEGLMDSLCPFMTRVEGYVLLPCHIMCVYVV